MQEYLDTHCSPEHPYLHELYRATQTTLLRPRMASGHVQGQFLKMLCQMIDAQLVVEIGTFSGYSALSMASGMTHGKIVTFEINDEQEDFTRPWLENAPFKVQIDMVIGDALELIPKHNDLKDIDLAFIDANKRDYRKYYEMLLPRMRKGGILAIDNTLWDGHVTEIERHDSQTTAIREFNDFVAQDERVECVLLPMRDGLTLARIK